MQVAYGMGSTLAAEINCQYLALTRTHHAQLLPDCVQYGDWLSLSASSRARIASFPVSLIAFRSSRPEGFGEGAADHNPGVQPDASMGPRLPLARSLLIAMWQLAQFAPDDLLMMGIAPSQAPRFVDMRLTDLERIALQESESLGPRWSDDHQFWGALLEAARTQEIGQLCRLRVHALQLLARDLL